MGLIDNDGGDNALGLGGTVGGGVVGKSSPNRRSTSLEISSKSSAHRSWRASCESRLCSISELEDGFPKPIGASTALALVLELATGLAVSVMIAGGAVTLDSNSSACGDIEFCSSAFDISRACKLRSSSESK